ncbi:MAG: ROK family protein [Pseudomonadota bacterium]
MNAPETLHIQNGLGCGPMLLNELSPNRTHRQQVFECVRAAGAISRIDVAKSLGISPGSVTAIVTDLMEAELLYETDETRRDSGRGRPPVALSVSPRARYVVGVKLSDHSHTAVATDFAGNTLGSASLQTTPKRRPMAEAVAETQELLDRVLRDAGLAPADISAMAIGLPGIVDHASGRVPWCPLIAEENCAMRAALEDALPFAVHIDNDANMVTIAELWFGAGRARSDFAVVTIENGLGMGLVTQNQVFRGGQGQGLELGHTKVQMDGALCRCGRRGCLEAYVADYALEREAATALLTKATEEDGDRPVLQALFKSAKAGHAPAQAIFQRAGRYLAAGLANIIQLFDPPLILISGARMQYDYLYADEVLAATREMTAQAGRAPVEIEIHTWGDLVWAQGAAALALQNLTDELLRNQRVTA